MRDEKNGETRAKTKKWGRRDTRKKNREMRRKATKNGDTRQEMEKKWGDETRHDKKMGRRDA